MQNLPKDNESLRIILITIFSVLGIVMVILGWKMTGKLAGLGIIAVGVALLLTSMGIYNEKYN
ncbi:hypothetical protein QE109_14640 [Fusibacter bizertensis]|uniref:DUF2892 domain-containing protein n=1 Tax=Fusibacter bizertensis TaxID=1488331 RepID=A0ABT6NGA7_9FIRM|nr:hypothetical protein [Fusibacter bizertensis]MDH8679393.1 hypothetical protein [Fusibacter bizertensis]